MDNSTTIASGWMALVISTAMIAAGCGVRRPSTVPKCHHGRTLLASVALSVLAIPAWAQVRITDSNIPFLYESRAAVRTPDHKLAAIISTDYRNADDEFTRHDLFRQLKPVIESRLSQAAQHARVYLLIGARLGDYDFDRSAFPTGMSESTFIRFAENLFSVLGHYGYQVRFDNADQIAFVPVPPERARSFASALRRSREVSFRVEGQISRVAEDESKIVYMNVTKIVISLKRNQREIVSYEIPRRSPDEQSAAPPSSTPPAPPVERIAPTFDYTPPANGHPGSANVTFAVVGSRSLTSMWWTLGEPGFERFSSSMARDFAEILKARGYAARGPFGRYSEMAFPDKEGSDLVLSATVNFTPDTSALEVVQLGVPNAVSAMFELDAYADARSHFKGTVRVEGRVTLVITESLTNEKMWTKRIDAKPINVAVNSTLPYLSVGQDTFLFSHLLEHDNQFYTDLGRALAEQYMEVMGKTYAYLDPEEMATVDRQADSLRERNRN